MIIEPGRTGAEVTSPHQPSAVALRLPARPGAQDPFRAICHRQASAVRLVVAGVAEPGQKKPWWPSTLAMVPCAY
jgi:hypothetical protein